MHLIHRCQQGFTTITLMGVLMVGGMLVAASFAVVDPDISLSQKDDDSKQAYAAAEAGLSYYMNRLSQDSGYYTHCANVPSPTLNAVNNEWNGTGADPRAASARFPATSPTTRWSCSPSRTPPSPGRSCAWRTCPAR